MNACLLRALPLFVLVSGAAAAAANAQISPDDVAAARRLLDERVRQQPAPSPLEAARDLIRQHRYADAAAAVERELRNNPRDPNWQALRVRLLIQAWRLDEALEVARSIPNDVLIGRVQLLQKDYDAALEAARRAQRANPNDAEVFLLEADVHFWQEKPELAEAPLRRALELDPLNADARFAYGYAIWRRVDARQLPQMAEQWNLALAIDSLHYLTHWHFGNGHTHLTYADYAQPDDDEVRRELARVDSMIAAGQIDVALAETRRIEQIHPNSLLPTMMRGSIFYMAPHMERAARLDSAQAVFLGLLRRKPNYGPAHNALAAVIKQRQFTYHEKFDSLEAEIARQAVPADSAFYRVFRNIRYYPGDRVIKMAVQQLGPALAYIPFIARLGYTYVIPPLHHDLSHAMNTPFFRTSTTFDNRQWMDIRGSGGNNASAGIEYVERGSHQERVVLLHEYVHQFHSAVLTDAQVRRIRQLYHDAMANNRTLDYYSANNESEFFAQVYEAYLSPVKVHPLNHKAMNTRADLIRKDPQTFAFLDTLIAGNRAFLAGDSSAMRENWAQVYVSLARRARAAGRPDSAALARAHVLLDSAALLAPGYVPALIERAALYRTARDWRNAEGALRNAERIAPRYAPIYDAWAQLLGARAQAERRNAYVNERVAYYNRALELETDLAEGAALNRALRELYAEQALFADAIALADDFVRTAPVPSTYLRDRRDDAAAFAADLRSSMGHDETPFFDELVARKPQNFGLRAQAIWAHWRVGHREKARELLAGAERVMRAGGGLNQTYRVLRAIIMADSAAAAFVDSAVTQKASGWAHTEMVRLAEHLLRNGRTDAGLALLPADSTAIVPRERADILYLRSLAAESETAVQQLREALRIHPYHADARLELVRRLVAAGQDRAARAAGVDDVARLGLGPLYHQAVQAILAQGSR